MSNFKSNDIPATAIAPLPVNAASTDKAVMLATPRIMARTGLSKDQVLDLAYEGWSKTEEIILSNNTVQAAKSKRRAR